MPATVYWLKENQSGVLDMGKLFFLLKMAIFTVIVVGILQIKVGTSTLEEKVLKAAHYGPVSETIHNFGKKVLFSVKEQCRQWSSQIDSFLQEKLDDFQKESESNKDKKQ